jgi:hypothetical protein
VGIFVGVKEEIPEFESRGGGARAPYHPSELHIEILRRKR